MMSECPEKNCPNRIALDEKEAEIAKYALAIQENEEVSGQRLEALTAEVERLKGYEELYCSEAKDNMNAEKKIASLEAQVNGLREALNECKKFMAGGVDEEDRKLITLIDSALSSPPVEPGAGA